MGRAGHTGAGGGVVDKQGLSSCRGGDTYLHRVMSIRLGLASVTRENVIGAAGAHGSCHVCLDATFEGVGAWGQTTPLEQSAEDNPGRSSSRFPHLPWLLPPPGPRAVQEGR